MATELHTIGYEGATLDSFLTALRRAQVRLVIDVRAIAASRRRGFSKTALANALAEADVAYLHLRDLGDPKPGRDAARAGRMSDFLRIYRAHLRSASAQAALTEAMRVAQEQTACLLCYEGDPVGCHRTIVAAAIAERTGIAVQHLYPDPPTPRAGSAIVARRKPRSHVGAGEGRPTGSNTG